MPHSTSTTTERRSPLPVSSRPILATIPSGASLKASAQEQFPTYQGGDPRGQPWKPPNPTPYNSNPSVNLPTDGWRPRRDSYAYHANESRGGDGTRHGRQKSLSDAFHNIRTRRGSVSANAHELADALKAPVSPKLIVSSLSCIGHPCDDLI